MSTIAASKTDTELDIHRAKPAGRASHIVTWVLQVLVGLQFVFAGAMKFIMPMEEMTKDLPLPAAFLYFIGVAELAGGLGLMLPGALRTLRGLTPLAAGGLSIIMAGAVVTCAMTDVSMIAMPLVVGALTGFIAWRRWSWMSELRGAR